MTWRNLDIRTERVALMIFRPNAWSVIFSLVKKLRIGHQTNAGQSAHSPNCTCHQTQLLPPHLNSPCKTVAYGVPR